MLVISKVLERAVSDAVILKGITAFEVLFVPVVSSLSDFQLDVGAELVVNYKLLAELSLLPNGMEYKKLGIVRANALDIVHFEQAVDG